MVEMSTDGWRTWRPAQLQEPVLPKCLTRFRFPWRGQGADAMPQSRYTDETGYVHPARADLLAVRGVSSAYHYHAVHSWRAARNGTVTNVHV